MLLQTDLSGTPVGDFRLQDGLTPVGLALREGSVLVGALDGGVGSVVEEVDMTSGTYVTTRLDNTVSYFICFHF